MVDYDLSFARRTRVIDDELDYFSTDGGASSIAWLSPEVRARVVRRVAELKSQKNSSRMQSTLVNIDLDTGKVSKEVNI